jgi:drug/metabolite transporter (DMT)-like permease
MLVIIKYKKMSILGPKGKRLLLCGRAFFSIFAVISTNFAIKYIDPSDNIALSHTNIIFTALFARIFLKEKINFSHLIALLLTIGGAFLISKPSFIFGKEAKIATNTTIMHNETNLTSTSTSVCLVSESREISSTDLSQLIGVAFAIVGALGSAAIHIIIKNLCKNKVYYAVSTIYGSYLGLPASFILSLVLILTGSSHKNFQCELKYLGLDILFGCLGGICAVYGHVLLNLSLQHEDATKVSIVRTVDVVFSFILQFIILNIQADWISIVGALLILMSTFVILFYKIILEKIREKRKEKKTQHANKVS